MLTLDPDGRLAADPALAADIARTSARIDRALSDEHPEWCGCDDCLAAERVEAEPFVEHDHDCDCGGCVSVFDL